MSTQNQIEKGVIYATQQNTLIPVYGGSNFYFQGAAVVPDGVNWFEAKKYDSTVAVHESEKGYLCREVIDSNGDVFYAIEGRYNYVRASRKSSEGGYLYFASEEAAERNDFKFSLRLGRFHDANCPEFSGEEKVLDYHRSQKIDRARMLKLHTDADEWLCGLEVEKVDSILAQQGDAWKILEETGWCKERDGSLGDGGYEFVSPILPLFRTDIIEKSTSTIKKWIDGRSSDKCGGHITISNSKLNGEELMELCKNFAPIFYSIYENRIGNNYCLVRNWGNYLQYRDRYNSFSLKGGLCEVGARVELRLPSRVANQKQLIWRCELLQKLLTGGNLNQLAQKIGCPEASLYKHFAKQFEHSKIGEKLVLVDKYAKQYGTHKNGISPSVKKRINNTMGYIVFPEVEAA